MKEGSEVELVMNDIPSDTGQAALIADEGNVGTILHVFPSGRSIQYPITIKTVNVIDDGKAGALSVKGKVSGTIVRGTTVQQLSALTVSAGTLFPVFAAGTYEYQLPETNGTASITVTPTSASASITVDGTAVTSGAASGAIALTAGAITTIEIIVQRTGYTTTVYKIKAARAAT
jgi:copper chaperone CopZ